jgi:hypothetical protein
MDEFDFDVVTGPSQAIAHALERAAAAQVAEERRRKAAEKQLPVGAGGMALAREMGH